MQSGPMRNTSRDRDRRRRRGGGGGGAYVTIHCHHQNCICIKTGSDESHLNVSRLVRDTVIKQCPDTTTHEEEGEPNWEQNRVDQCSLVVCAGQETARLSLALQETGWCALHHFF